MTALLMTADEAAQEWPKIDNAIGCLDCMGVFLRPEALSNRCPHCRSESVFDFTASGPDRRVTSQHLKMIARLDEVLDAIQP